MMLYEESTEVRCPNCDALCAQEGPLCECEQCAARFGAIVRGGRVLYDLRRTVLPIEIDWDDVPPTIRSAN